MTAIFKNHNLPNFFFQSSESDENLKNFPKEVL